jgi:pimeloyl-ACP methyl ester carboxylesterase
MSGRGMLARGFVAGRAAVKWALVAAVAAAVAGPASAGAAELPEKDPFYKPPAGFEETTPGTVLRSRSVSFGGNGFGVPGYQLLFRSSDTHGEPIAAVTSYAVPPTPWTGTGQRPLVSYQMAIDGLGGKCTPSYQLQQGNSPEAETAAGMYAKGWAVNIPDHEGLDMEYGAGRNGAHVTLDSIRALYNFSAAKVSSSNPVGLIGYSGGGQATAWTLEEQPSYAPDLHFTAAAPGGIPVDLKEVVEYNDGGPAFSLVLAASQGVSRAYPEMELESLLNAAGTAAMQKLKNQCLSEYVYEYPNKKFSEFTKPEYSEPLSLPQVENVLADDSLAKATPDAPVFLWQSAADEVIPVAGVDKLANYYCSAGLEVTYDRGASGEHVSFADNAPVAVAYLEAYFNGETVPSTCGTLSSADTHIDSGPSGQTTSSSATFTYSASPEVAGATFECKLDEAAFASCPSSGITYTGLANGQHTFAVRSVTPAGNEDVSPATRSWTYFAVPAVSKVEPSEGPLAGGTTVTITGANLAGASAVKFGSADAASYAVNSATSITAVSPAGTGSVDVTVTTPGGTSATVPADQFTYVAVPVLTRTKPKVGPVGGGTTVTITGANFRPGTAVSFGSTPAASVTVNSPTSITAVSPAHLAGSVDVRVTTAGGTSATSKADRFKFTPTITGVSPSSGSTAGGETVTITGTGFVSGQTMIKFGTRKATAVSCVSWDVANPAAETTCTVSSPAHGAETVNVRATVNKATSPKTAGDRYTYA